MALSDKYELRLNDHLINGEDLEWDFRPGERVLAEALLRRSCVIGVDMNHQLVVPGYTGVLYPEGLYCYILTLRIVEERSDEPEPGDTRKHELTQWWWTLRCDGMKQVAEVLAMARPHPNEEGIL